MLFQPTNIIPDTRTGIGFGTVDVNDGIQVSWQVNGDYPVMTAFRIIIYLNDTASTQKYDSGKLTAGCPFNGRDAQGNINFFAYTIPSATLAQSGITNGHEYKLTIRQYYTDGGTETSINQSSASVFLTRSTPTFAITTPNVTAAEYTFSWTFSQAQNDTLDLVRYQVQIVGGSYTEVVYDSGNIYGTSVYECTYSGFLRDQAYRVRATGQTSSGVLVDSGWTTFVPNYAGTSLIGTLTAQCVSSNDAVKVEWDISSYPGTADTWVLYRKQSGQLSMHKVGEFRIQQTSVYDFAAASGQGPYTYYLFAALSGESMSYLSTQLPSNNVNPVRACWTLLDCEENQDGVYRVLQEFHFKNNLNSGSVSNNNSPNVLQNFTAMPTVQLSPSNYKSGTLSALIGRSLMGQYGHDTLELREALMALSTTNDTLFLKSSKGDVMMVSINGAITVDIADTIKSQPQVISVPWIEIDDSPVSLVAYPGDDVIIY